MFSTLRSLLTKSPVPRNYSAFAPETIFNEENIRKTIEKFGKFQSAKPQTNLPTKNAAVLVPLCTIHGKVSLLYTVRAANLTTHRGQISFPGGMEDAGDLNAEQTASRETQEELGVSPDRIQIWGRGGVIENRNRTRVLPVVGTLDIGDLERDLNFNRSEVKEVFTVPLEVLCDPGYLRHTQFRTNLSLPVFIYGKKKIWGLTAVITHMFLKSLMPRDVYRHNIQFVPPLKAGLPYRLL